MVEKSGVTEKQFSEADPIHAEAEDNRPAYLKKDLLSMIAAEDREVEKEKKSRDWGAAYGKAMQKMMMRSGALFNLFLRKYANVLYFFALFWRCVTVALYVGGILSVLVIFVSYASYPSVVRRYFRANDIQLESWHLESYTLSKIVLTDLRDANGGYEIKKAVIRSSFSDFLKRKIKSVTFDGITLNILEENGTLKLPRILDLMTKINDSRQSGYHVDSIAALNSTINLKGQQLQLPIHFSMTGLYKGVPNVSIPLTIKDKNINISGMLAMTGSKGALDWNLNILSGNLSLPNRQPENVTGKLKFSTKGVEIQSVNGSLSFAYGKNKKDVKIDLRRNKEQFKGSVSLDIEQENFLDKSEANKMNLSLNFDALSFKSLSQIETSSPIRVSVQSLSMHDFDLSSLSTTLTGDLKCRGFDCVYQMSSDAQVTVQRLKTIYYGYLYTSKNRSSFTLKPNKRANFKLSPDALDIDLDLSALSFDATRDVTTSDLKMNATGGSVKGRFSFHGGNNLVSQMALSLSGLSYESSDVRLKNASIAINDIWSDRTDFTLNAPETVFKDNRLMKVPLELVLTRQNNVVVAKAYALGRSLSANFQGAVNFISGTFQGEFLLRPFDLRKLPRNLTQVSELLPTYIQDLSGRMAAYGKILWKGDKQVTGPFYASFEDVNFTSGGMPVSGMNTVLLVQSLNPFLSSADQHVFVRKIAAPILFQNVDLRLKFDNQMVRLGDVSAQVAGATLSGENILLPYRANTTALYLKSKGQDVDLNQVSQYLNIADFTMDGHASASVAVGLDDGKFVLNNSEVRMSSVSLNYTGNNPKLRESLFRTGNEFFVKNGNIVLSQGNEDLTAYLNFEGRVSLDQVRPSYKGSVQFDYASTFKEMSDQNVPADIQEKQRQIMRVTGGEFLFD